jgi:hypothetical protein
MKTFVVSFSFNTFANSISQPINNNNNSILIFAIQILALAVCAVSAFPQGRVAVDEVAVEPEAKSTTTPVPIIKQINKVNDDGSYTFGYEAGDGSFRIEKKELNGYVKGIRPN